jgi:murein L,D-transpeptidase YcbB/YkuD
MNKTTVIDNCNTHLTNSDKTSSNLNFHKRAFKFFVAVIPVAIVLLLSTSYQQNNDGENFPEQGYFSPEAVDSLRAFLLMDKPDSQVVIAEEKPLMLQAIRSFYLKNAYRPVWTNHRGLNGRAIKFLDLIAHAHEYGLEPHHYHMSAITGLRLKMENISQPVDKSAISANIELLITDAAFQFMVNLHSGYRSYDSTLYSADWVAKLPDLLLEGSENGNIIENILSVQPRFVEYFKLRAANENFIRSTVITDEWIDINYPTKDSTTLYGQVEKALRKSGYLDRNSNHDDLTNAIKEFQFSHGLKPDGKPGKNTIEALEQSTLYKYRVLALNLDRLRKKQDLDSNLLYINIPAFQMKVYHGNTLMDTFRVIVGHPTSPTPTLSARMNKIIANPTWFVPKSITMREILPKIKSDSNYLKRNKFKVLDKEYKTVSYESLNLADISENNFEYTLRQDRGSDNSLGQVKFIFSSPYAIYIHDTPGKSMFLNDSRAYSHGCVRVQYPERLAGYILHEINADTTNIARLIKAGKHREFAVTSSLAVEILYITCEADDAGRLFFYKDIYGNDKKELEQLSDEIGI